MKHGVIYLNLGTSFVARLLVSLDSLRRHYAGPICVISGADEASVRGADWLRDYARNLDVDIIPTHSISAKESPYVAKTKLHRLTPFDANVLLDADTLVVGPINDLFPVGDELVLTGFSNWCSNESPVSSRLRRISHADTLVTEQLSKAYAAVNTGVIGFRKGTDAVHEWERLAALNPLTNLVDEVVMQVLYPTFAHRLLDDRFNLSPIYGCNRQDPRVWHFHGDKHLIAESAGIWLAAFNRLWQSNASGIQSWAPAGDEQLARYLSETSADVR